MLEKPLTPQFLHLSAAMTVFSLVYSGYAPRYESESAVPKTHSFVYFNHVAHLKNTFLIYYNNTGNIDLIGIFMAKLG